MFYSFVSSQVFSQVFNEEQREKVKNLHLNLHDMENLISLELLFYLCYILFLLHKKKRKL